MKMNIVVVVVAAILSQTVQTARAGDRVCDEISGTVNQLERGSLIPESGNMRAIVSMGLNPYNIQTFVGAAYRFSQTYMLIRNLKQEYVNRSCSVVFTTLTPACASSLAVAPSVNVQYQWVHDNFARAVLSGNLPSGLPLVGELFRTENILQELNSAIRTNCAPR